jgi:hypothetical protein
MNIYYTFDNYNKLPNEIQNHIISFLPQHHIINLINNFNLKSRCIQCNKIKHKNNKISLINSNVPNKYCIEFNMCNHLFCETCIVNCIKLNNYDDKNIYCIKCQKNMFCIFQTYYDKIDFQEYLKDMKLYETPYD